MIDKIKERIESWEIRAWLFTILFLSIGAFVSIYFTDIRDKLRHHNQTEFKGQTSAVIISVNPIDRIKQSKVRGTEIFIDHYEVSYTYSVSGQRFQKTDMIPTSKRNEKFLTRLVNRGERYTFLVKYNIVDPAQCILIDSK